MERHPPPCVTELRSLQLRQKIKIIAERSSLDKRSSRSRNQSEPESWNWGTSSPGYEVWVFKILKAKVF